MTTTHLEHLQLGGGAHPPGEVGKGALGKVFAAAHAGADAVVAEHHCCIAVRIPSVGQPVGFAPLRLACR